MFFAFEMPLKASQNIKSTIVGPNKVELMRQ